MTDTENRPADQPAEDAPDLIWVLSNRRDDRAAFYDRSARHPGGVVLVGGTSPVQVARNARVEAALREGVLIEIPEPPNEVKDPQTGEMVPNRKKPVAVDEITPPVLPAMPGQPTPLGRDLDPDLVPPAAAVKVEGRRRSLPRELPVPSGVEVPPRPEPTTRR